jgi:hypothetical protein
MPRYNVLLGCDQKYYNDWAVPLLKSIQRHNPWLSLHCHIVNPTVENSLDNVSITTEKREFLNDEAKISYLQSVRFLAVAEKFNKNENVVTLDADSICTRPIVESTEMKNIFQKQYVLKHHKEDRWLAGLVVFNQNGFRQELNKELTSVPFDNWQWGRDQIVLNTFANEFNFQSVGNQWMSIGKNKANSVFLTLKGNQKVKEKFLVNYNRYKNQGTA